MPFTGAHPFAILPLTRVRWLDASCLAIGAMAPDLEYFARGHMSGTKLGHTLPGIAIWCVPITLVVAWLYHRLVAPALLDAAPIAIARRVRATRWPRAWSIATLAMVVGSAALGALTHLAWDGFTHVDGFAVRRIAALQGDVLGVPIHRVLQLGCSGVGVVGIAIVVALRVARADVIEPRPIDRRVSRWLFAVAIAVGVPLAVLRAHAIGAFTSGDLIVAPITGALAGILLASAIVRARVRYLIVTTTLLL